MDLLSCCNCICIKWMQMYSLSVQLDYYCISSKVHTDTFSFLCTFRKIFEFLKYLNKKWVHLQWSGIKRFRRGQFSIYACTCWTVSLAKMSNIWPFSFVWPKYVQLLWMFSNNYGTTFYKLQYSRWVNSNVFVALLFSQLFSSTF